MDHIEKMAAECMKDPNDDEGEAEDEDLEKDTDLLVCVTLLARSFSMQNIPYKGTGISHTAQHSDSFLANILSLLLFCLKS